MLDDAFRDGWGWWVVALAVGVPVLLVVLTELINGLRRRNNPLAGPLRLLRNGVIPVGALFALPPALPFGRARTPLRAEPAAPKGLGALPSK
jgi:hypothetical protein